MAKSLEYLLQLYPNKTGKEILEIQQSEIKEDVERDNELNKSKLEFINDINTNGGYYKGRFGEDQRFYYKLSNLRLEFNKIYGDVEDIVVFLGGKDSVVKFGEARIEKRLNTFKDISKYDLEMYVRTTKEDYDEVNKYLYLISNFWNDIKKV